MNILTSFSVIAVLTRILTEDHFKNNTNWTASW